MSRRALCQNIPTLVQVLTGFLFPGNHSWKFPLLSTQQARDEKKIRPAGEQFLNPLPNGVRNGPAQDVCVRVRLDAVGLGEAVTSPFVKEFR